MTLFITMLPIYLFGNLHCLGMCGPLVMMIGQHRYRYFYFFGRLVSFGLAGMVAGAIGEVANVFFRHYHLAEAASFFFGGIMIFLGIQTLMGWGYPGQSWLSKKLAKTSQNLSLLILRDKSWPTFLFGFFTLALPCGQTLIVFSACALSGDPAVGLLNGLAFALLTSPSLFFAMQAHSIFKKARQHYQKLIGGSAIIVGLLAILRGLAEKGFISHWIINPEALPYYHFVIY